MKKAKIIIDGKTYEGELVEVIEEPKFNDPWEPKGGVIFTTISECGGLVDRMYSTNDVNPYVRSGNCFKADFSNTASIEAKRESLMRRMRNFARANGGEGFYVIEQRLNPIYGIAFYAKKSTEGRFGEVRFKSMEVAEEAIKRYGDEIKELYK